MKRCTVPNLYETSFNSEPCQTISLDLASLALGAADLLNGQEPEGKSERERARHRVAIKHGLRALAAAAPSTQ